MNKVKNYRKFINYTQQNMADLLDISLQSYWKKENKKVPFSDDEKVKITTLFREYVDDITIEALFF